MNKTSLSLLVAAVLVSGCASSTYDSSKGNTQSTIDAVASARQMAKDAQAPAERVQQRDFYINTRSIAIRDDAELLPAIFRTPAQINVNQRASLRDIANILSRASGLRFSFAPDVTREAEATALYNNFKADTPLKSLLDQISAQLNMSWRYRNGSVEFFRFETRTFYLSIAPGTTTYTTSMSGVAGLGAGGSGGSGGSGGGGAAAGGTRIATTMTLSRWDALENDLKAIVRQGTFSSAPTNASLTVTATPSELSEVENHLRSANMLRNSRQVVVTARIYEVTQNTTDNYGLNWNAIYTSLSRSLNVSFGAGSAASALPGGLGIAFDSAGASAWAGSSAVLQALSTQGTTSVVTTISRMGSTGNPLALANSRQQAYVANSTSTVVPNAGTATTSQTATVGEGTDFSVVPQISGDLIRLDGSLRLQTIDRIREFTSGTSRSQLPEVSTIDMPINISLRSGQALLMSGHQANVNSFDRSGVGSAARDSSWLTGGARNARTQVKHYVLLLSAELVDVDAGEVASRAR